MSRVQFSQEGGKHFATLPNGEKHEIQVGDAAIADQVAQRWHADAALRRIHGVKTTDRNDPFYQARLRRLIAAEMKCANDQRCGSGTAALSPTPAAGDLVSEILRNPNMTKPWLDPA